MAKFEQQPPNIFVSKLLAGILPELDRQDKARKHLVRALATRKQRLEWLGLDQVAAGKNRGAGMRILYPRTSKNQSGKGPNSSRYPYIRKKPALPASFQLRRLVAFIILCGYLVGAFREPLMEAMHLLAHAREALTEHILLKSGHRIHLPKQLDYHAFHDHGGRAHQHAGLNEVDQVLKQAEPENFPEREKVPTEPKKNLELACGSSSPIRAEHPVGPDPEHIPFPLILFQPVPDLPPPKI